MAAIDRQQLLEDELLWLPPTNVLTEAQMMQINELVIANELPADDDIYYSQALCLGLRAIATANLGKATAGTGGMRKQIVGDVEVEWFDDNSAADVWRDFIDSLRDICPLFGYYGLGGAGGIKITPGKAPVINPCPCPDEF